MSGTGHTANARISEGDHVSVMYLMIDVKQLQVRIARLIQQRKLRPFPEHFGVRLPEEGLGAGKDDQKICRAEMIKVTVGVHDIPDIPRVKSRLPDGLDHLGPRLGIGRVDQDQTLVRIEQVGAHIPVPDEPKISVDPDGFM